VINFQDQVLYDKRKNGKIFDWKKLKNKNMYLSKIFEELEYFSKSEKISCCGEFLKFVRACDNDWQGLKLIEANFCKHKLCPLCNKRRSMKHAIQVKRILTVAREKEPKARFLFLTLTDKNAYDGDSLNSALKHMSKSFNKLIKRAKVQRNFVGAMRVTEVTINEENGSYNQHLHVLLMVKSSYFYGNGDNYISHSEWTSIWRESLGADYSPIVHVQVVKPNKTKAKNEMDLDGAIYEVAKYPVKDNDYLTGNISKDMRRVDDLDIGLFRKRLVSYLGLLKDIKKQLGLTDVESEKVDLVSDDDNKNIDEISEYIVFRWNKYKGNYYKF
jgi:plasmid rolling circle replication initiator protein Rep